MSQTLSLNVDTLKEVELTEVDMNICDANITMVELSGSVSVNYETFKISLGGDVPQDVGWLKFTKFLYNKVNWLRQGIRQNMEVGFETKLGNSLRRKQE